MCNSGLSYGLKKLDYSYVFLAAYKKPKSSKWGNDFAISYSDKSSYKAYKIPQQRRIV